MTDLTASKQWVSIHGGHSGEFCSHATDTLEEVVSTYINKGFHWVGITEHIPPIEDRYLYPEEIKAGFNSKSLYNRFEQFITSCRHLQRKYSDKIKIYVGFETEYYRGAIQYLKDLIQKFEPDYIVGSVHHVDDISFDYSEKTYNKAIKVAGGIEALYCRYFDAQYQMITELRPPVVGHFDLIRIYDPDYKQHINLTQVRDRVQRNLELIRRLNLILDVNARALTKGADEPYPTLSILKQAVKLGIPLVPGDDSHGIDTVGLNIDRVIKVLIEVGADTNWRLPV